MAPQAAGAPSDDKRAEREPSKYERRLAEASDALCPDWFGPQRKWLAATPIVIGLRCFTVGGPVAACCYVIGSGLLSFANTMDVTRFLAVLGIIASGIAFSLTVSQLRFVLLVDEDELAAMGAGQTNICASDLKPLTKLRRNLRVLKVTLLAVGVLVIMAGIGNSFWNPWSVVLYTPYGLAFMVVGPFFCDFVLSLEVAAVLAAHAVLGVDQAVRTVVPEDEEAWETHVVWPTLALCNGAIAHLSRGWGRGLLLAYVGCWSVTFAMFVLLIGLASFPGMMSKEGMLYMLPIGLLSMLFLYLPKAMSVGVAGVSTACDQLFASVNERRIEDLRRDQTLQALERALGNLNNGQGLGFTVAGVVLDIRRLTRLFVSVFGLFFTAIPIAGSLVAFTQIHVVQYGAMDGSARIFAYSPVHRTYADSVEFCHTIWMEIASVHSVEENRALAQLMGNHVELTGGDNFGASAWLGATPNVNEGLAWDDGSEWDYEPPGFSDNLECWNDDETCHVVGPGFSASSSLKHDEGEWELEAWPMGVMCAAPSITDLKGGLPRVRHLGGRGRAKRTASECAGLSSSDRATIRMLVGNRSACVANVTLGDLVTSGSG
jgi:hypothetical protein